MSQVFIKRKVGSYTKDNVERKITNFYLSCGNASLIPIKVTYFSKGNEPDNGYHSRCEILKSYASEFDENSVALPVQLVKQHKTYKDKNGVEKQAVNYSLRCGSSYPIAIEVPYFKDKKTGVDFQYSGRRAVLESFATEWVSTASGVSVSRNPQNNAPSNRLARISKPVANDADLPF